MLPIGQVIRYGGSDYRVGAVGWVGERYYWLVRMASPNVVAMVPAALLERPHQEPDS